MPYSETTKRVVRTAITAAVDKEEQAFSQLLLAAEVHRDVTGEEDFLSSIKTFSAFMSLGWWYLKPFMPKDIGGNGPKYNDSDMSERMLLVGSEDPPLLDRIHAAVDAAEKRLIELNDPARRKAKHGRR